MEFRTIKEGMKEAHETADKFGGTWYVLDTRDKSVVKESYFITDDGDRKVKPFVSLYNTSDMKYGRDIVQWVNNEIIIDRGDIQKNRFKQPYGIKFVEEDKKAKEYIMLGDPHFGHTHHIELAKSIALSERSLGTIHAPTTEFNGTTLLIEDSFKELNLLKEPISLVKEDVFDISTGQMVKAPVNNKLSKSKRIKLRKKRKKKKK